jgi:hypothetical protein
VKVPGHTTEAASERAVLVQSDPTSTAAMATRAIVRRGFAIAMLMISLFREGYLFRLELLSVQALETLPRLLVAPVNPGAPIP